MYSMTVRINLAIKCEKKRDMLEFLLGHKDVVSVHNMRPWDYYIVASFETLFEYHAFVDDLQLFGLLNIDEHHILWDIKADGKILC
jgi:hypothetical protein